MSNDVSTDEAARLNKITGLNCLLSSLDSLRSGLKVAVTSAEPFLAPAVAMALQSTIMAVGSAHEMIQGQLALIPPPPPAPAGDEAAEGDA